MPSPQQLLPVISRGADHFLKLPFLVKGKLRYSPDFDPKTIRAAFDDQVRQQGKQPADVTYVKLEGLQVLREPVAAKEGNGNEKAWLYQVMPRVDPIEMGYFNPVALADELYHLPFENVLAYLGRLSAAVASGSPLSDRIKSLCAISSSIPAGFLEMAFASFGTVLSPKTAAVTIDNALAYMGHAGREFLDGWVPLPLPISPGAAMLSQTRIFGETAPSGKARSLRIRAMPTRQLHITAGNAPGIPFISAFRSFCTKSAALIKMPYGVTIPGALLALGMLEAGADHPITGNTSIVYWPGGDEQVENTFYQPDFFDRIVVWGAPGSVTNVKRKALFTKVLTFNPRYAVSFIGKEAFAENVAQAALKASTDTMIWNQKACIASLVHYVEGSEEHALEYCEALSEVMRRWDDAMPNYTPGFINGQIRRMRRGKLAGAKWFTNQKNGQFQSAVVYVPGEFDMADHPMWRLVIVRRVDDLSDCLRYMNASVSTVGIYPDQRRDALKDRIAACGVSNIVPLGEHERMIPGAPHDGMMVFSELVDWKNG